MLIPINSMGFYGIVFVRLAFIFLLLSFALQIAFFFNKFNRNRYIQLAKQSYFAHAVALLLALLILAWLFLTHQYQYYYVWKHSNNLLSKFYLISAVWSGQEGSFLFWITVQAFIGLTFLKFQYFKHHILPIIFSLLQLILLCNVLGLKLGNLNIGQHPFGLLKEASEFTNNPLFTPSLSAEITKDGMGLNPLLQNIWMTIHPPILFIGYAVAAIPFSIGFFILFTRQFEYMYAFVRWIKWSLLFLGLGIILGGIWAYESLAFNGFWTWDPVENLSLVPWLLLLSSLHFVNAKKSDAIKNKVAIIIGMFAFFAIIFASYLTRSGILKDTSVHAFAGNESLWQIFFMLAILALLWIIVIKAPLVEVWNILKDKNQSNPIKLKDYMGLLLLLASFQLLFTTSLPLINYIIGTNWVLPTNKIGYYNTWQLSFILLGIILLIINITKELNLFYERSTLFFYTAFIILIAGSITYSLSYFYSFNNPLWLIGAFVCSIYIISLLLAYHRLLSKRIFLLKTLAHLGSVLFIIGAIIAFGGKYYYLSSKKSKELVLIKDSIVSFNNHQSFLFKGSSINNNKIVLEIAVFDSVSQQKGKEKLLKPSIIVDRNRGNVYEPYVLSKWNKDEFNSIMYYENTNLMPFAAEENQQNRFILKLGDTVRLNNFSCVLNKIESGYEVKKIKDTIWNVYADIAVCYADGQIENTRLSISLNDRFINSKEYLLKRINKKIFIHSIAEENQTLNFMIEDQQHEKVILQIWVYPWIIIVWLGLLLMMAGIFTSSKENSPLLMI